MCNWLIRADLGAYLKVGSQGRQRCASLNSAGQWRTQSSAARTRRSRPFRSPSRQSRQVAASGLLPARSLGWLCCIRSINEAVAPHQARSTLSRRMPGRLPEKRMIELLVTIGALTVNRPPLILRSSVFVAWGGDPILIAPPTPWRECYYAIAFRWYRRERCDPSDAAFTICTLKLPSASASLQQSHERTRRRLTPNLSEPGVDFRSDA